MIGIAFPRLCTHLVMVPAVALFGMPWTCAPTQDAGTPTIDLSKGSNDDRPSDGRPQPPPSKVPPVAPVAPAPPKHEVVAPRETLGPRPAPAGTQFATLPDQVVVKALDAGQALFMRCFKRANDADPTLRSVKIKLHVELDAGGAVVVARSDAEDADFARCLERVARMLPFPAPNRPAAVDMPLFFRAS